MKQLNYLAPALLLLVLIFSSIKADDDKIEKTPTTATNSDTTRILEILVKKVNAYYRANNFQPLLPAVGWTKESEFEKYYYHLTTDTFQANSKNESHQDGMVEILQDTARPIKFFNYGTIRVANLGSDGTEKRDDLPEEKIVAIAKGFADIFLEEWDITDLKYDRMYWSKPYISGSNGKGLNYHSAGYWDVIWRRVTPSGVVFNEDSVKVKVYAKYGPSTLSIFYTTRYDEKPFTKIGEAKAMQLAKEVLPKVLKESGLEHLLGPKPTESQPARITEFIVRAPNRTSSSNPALNDGREGRHAYVVGFYLAGENNAGPVEKKLILHIDAETGELLNTVY